MQTHVRSPLFFTLFLVSLGFIIAPKVAFATPLNQETKVYLPHIAGGRDATNHPKLSDQELIAQALQEGKIDYGTSLLYRFYALFADERLPNEYRGTGSIGEDQTLFEQANDPTLSAEEKARLRPFLLRPDDPASIHSTQARSLIQSAVVPSGTVPCEGVWAAQSSAKAGVKVRVHTLCFNDYAEDIQAALALLETLWTPMTTMMGQPLADLGGPASGSTDEIDFYLLDPLGAVWREGENFGIRKGALAIAPSAEPFSGDRSSGFVLVARSDLGKPDMKSTLAHEFFHILQKAHNRSLAFHGPTEWWFVEASAKWAEWYFVPETSDAEVHYLFSGTFLSADQPLHRSYDISDEEKLQVAASAYASYIWPFFVQQEKGQSSMGEIWQELEKVGADWNKGLQVLDDDYPFALHFHRFALRNLNNDFGGDNPLGKRYVHLDPKFADGWMPSPALQQDLAPMPPNSTLLLTDTIPSLRAHYYYFTVSAKVRQVTFDLTGLQPLLNRKVGALVKIKGKPWEMRELVPDRLTFCRDNPAEDIEEIWFVASNHNTAIDQTVKGAIEVKTSDLACGCNIDTWARFITVPRWRAELAFKYEKSAAKEDRSVTILEQADVAATLERYAEKSFIGKTISGTATLDYHEICCKDYSFSLAGSGEPVPYDAEFNGATGYSRITLNFRESDCTYSFGGTPFVINAASAAPVAVGSAGGWFRALPQNEMILSGSGMFPVHSEEFILDYSGDFFSATHDSWLLQMLGENNLGNAFVTWRFTPLEDEAELQAPAED